MFVQQLSIEECHLALARARFGRLACARDDQPYVIPIYFAVDEAYIYAFSLAGQKLEWMRDNSRVCLEIDDVKEASDWMSVVVFGRYEELPDTPEYRSARGRAHDLLQARPMWWEPAIVPVAPGDRSANAAPVYYRISIEHVTGRRAFLRRRRRERGLARYRSLTHERLAPSRLTECNGCRAGG